MIIVAEHAGFCFGVNRAISLAKQHLKEGPLCVLGDLVHNQDVMNQLQAQGLKVITLDNYKNQNRLLIRAHGVTKQVFDYCQKQGIKIIDATCPYVKRIHQIVSEKSQLGYAVFVFGDIEHPEVQGILSYANNQAQVVTSIKDFLAVHSNLQKTVLVAQTTANRLKWAELVDYIRQNENNVEIIDTICNATTLRQHAAVDLATQVDIMLIVGGHNSSNTRRLFELCHNNRVPVYHIANATELDFSWFSSDMQRIGISAGASTPDWIIKEVILQMEKNLEQQEIVTEEEMVEGATEAVAEETPNEAVEANDMESILEEDVMSIRRGAIVTGKVIQVNDDEVIVDIAYKSEGIISLRELTNDPSLTPADVVSEGDEIEVYILRVSDENGNPVLSKRRADSIRAWDVVRAAYENNEEVTGTAVEVVKGGIIVNISGLRAFMPASLVDRQYVPDLNVFLGQELTAVIIELDRSKRRIVLSRQAVLEEQYNTARQETWNSLEVGQVREGVVQRLTGFGAFVDLGAVDGLVHISELSWGRVDHPSEVVKEGDKVTVKILNVDRENERVSLSLRQTLADPWESVEQNYTAGEVIEGKVVRTVSFGAFVELEPGVEGLVHISQLAWRHVENTEEVVNVGDIVNVKVLSVNKEEKRISLSIKETTERPQRSEQRRQHQSVSHTEQGNITLGDMFGDLLNKAKKKGE